MPEAAIPAFRPGALVGGFTLAARVSNGLDFQLWRVARPGAGPALLMKVLQPHRRVHAAAATGLLVEQTALARLTGPHAPRLVEAGEVAGLPWIVVERLPGATLHERLAAIMHSPDDVTGAGSRIADALADIHRQRVVHLGLGTSTILLPGNGPAALVGFRYSRHLDSPDLLGEEVAVPLGVPAFMAPEQILGVRSDPRSDLFALGAVLYLLATGRTPFGDPDSVPGLERRLYRDPRPPRAVSSCPPWLQEVILRCLEVDPARRYASAGEVAGLLRDPVRVVPTKYAARGARDGLWAVLRRRLRLRDTRAALAAGGGRRAPIVVAAVETGPAASPELGAAIRRAAAKTMRGRTRARLVCVTVLEVPPAGSDRAVEAADQGVKMRRLGELRQWAHPLGLPPDRASLHVVEATDAAAAIVAIAREQRVERLIVGARGSSPLRRLLGSTSSRVVAEAPCPVLVVRLPRR